MRRVDALLHRAKRLEGPFIPTVTILSYQDDQYYLQCGLWDGRGQGRTKTEETIHKTAAEAMEAYEVFLSRFKADRQAAAVLIDLSDLQGGGE